MRSNAAKKALRLAPRQTVYSGFLFRQWFTAGLEVQARDGMLLLRLQSYGKDPRARGPPQLSSH